MKTASQIFLEQEDNKYKHTIHEGQLSHEHGFIPRIPVQLKMPETHKIWDSVAGQLPQLIENFHVREVVKTMPVLSATTNDLSNEYLARAAIILNSLAHAYYYHDNSVPLAERAQKDPLPECIAKPWNDVTQRLRPQLKVSSRTIFDSVLCNWKIRDANKPLSIDNVELLVPVVGNEEERLFFMTILIMELKFAPSLAAMVNAQDAIKAKDDERLINEVEVIINSLNDVISCLNQINQNSYNKYGIDPIVWANTVIKLENAVAPGEVSGSGSSSPLFHAMDAFINREYVSELGKQFIDYQKILPETNREFILALAAEEASIINYARETGNNKLIRKCYELLSVYENLMLLHYTKALGYLEIAFSTGRESTNGGRNGLEHLIRLFKASMQERKKSLTVALPQARVVSNKQLAIGTHEIILETNDEHPRFKSGTKCCVYPENSSEEIVRYLEKLALSGSEIVTLNPSWVEYFTKIKGAVITSINVVDFLRYADLTDLKIKECSNSIDNKLSFVAFLLPLRPRIYSVSPIHENESPTKRFRLTVKQIEVNQTAVGTTGVASSYLSAAKEGSYITVESSSSRPLTLPKDKSTPIVMFAAGSGIAPFIGFIEERAQSGGTENWLFFSTRDRKQFYYSDILETHVKNGKLQCLPIFSRENCNAAYNTTLNRFIYADNENAQGHIDKLIKANNEQIADLIINKKAVVYVCGHGLFAKKVEASIKNILTPRFGNDTSKVERYIDGIIVNGDYQTDIFTRDIQTDEREYSLTEVAKHNTHDSIWVVINESVYDITGFAGQHPGGKKIFQSFAGKYADSGYQAINHSSSQQINSQLASYKIGKIRKLELSSKPGLLYLNLIKCLHTIVSIQNIANIGFDSSYIVHKVYLYQQILSTYTANIAAFFKVDVVALAKVANDSIEEKENAREIQGMIQILSSADYYNKITGIIEQTKRSFNESNDEKMNVSVLRKYEEFICLTKYFIEKIKNIAIKALVSIESNSSNIEPKKQVVVLNKIFALLENYLRAVDKRFFKKSNEKIVIVGGGLTGLVLSAFLAKQGLAVAVYDALPDPRSERNSENRSINITLCERGLAALKEIGAYDAVLKRCVPIKGRMIHKKDNPLTTQLYGNNNESLYSIGREDLALVLLELIDDKYLIEFNFNEKCTHVDIHGKSLIFVNTKTGAKTDMSADLIFGADGVGSKVREYVPQSDKSIVEKMKSPQVYKEVVLPAELDDWPLDQNYLHVWPRNNFMLLGFPNHNKSFTLSLHIRESGAVDSLANITTISDYHQFFKSNFPDVYPMIVGSLDDSFNYPTGHIVSVKCNNWVYEDKLALIGDAAHAIFPYYGQGANSGFEDCKVLMACYQEMQGDWLATLKKYQSLRKPNTDVICELAHHHLTTLTKTVADDNFVLREKVSSVIPKVNGELQTLYHNIAFTQMPYAEAVEHNQKFQKLVDKLLQHENIYDLVNQQNWELVIASEIKKLLAANKSNQRNSYHKQFSTKQGLHEIAGLLFFSVSKNMSSNIHTDLTLVQLKPN